MQRFSTMTLALALSLVLWGCGDRMIAGSGDEMDLARSQLRCGGPVMQKLYPWADEGFQLGGQCLDAFPLSQGCGPSCEDGSCEAQAPHDVDCVVHEIYARGTEHELVDRLPRCPVELFEPAISDCGDDCPCWRILHDAAECSAELEVAPLKLDVLRAGPTQPGTIAMLTCSMPEGFVQRY